MEFSRQSNYLRIQQIKQRYLTREQKCGRVLGARVNILVETFKNTLNDG
jgi:hypothetical protein